MPDGNDMPSHEDQLRDHLREIYHNALSHVMPPGVDVIRRNARRRVATRITANVVLVIAMAVAALAQSWWAPTGGTPAAPPTSTPTPGPASARPTESAAPTTPATTESAAPTTFATASAGAGAARPDGGSTASGDECVPGGVVDVTELINDGYTTVSLRLPAEHPDWEGLLCPGETVRVLWASYTVDPAGVQHLYRFEERVLDLATPTWRMYIDMKWEGLCGPTWYVSKGSDAIPSTIPLGGSAFPNKFHWDDENAEPGCDPTPIPS